MTGRWRKSILPANDLSPNRLHEIFAYFFQGYHFIVFLRSVFSFLWPGKENQGCKKSRKGGKKGAEKEPKDRHHFIRPGKLLFQ
jgi:hypothetical protein